MGSAGLPTSACAVTDGSHTISIHGHLGPTRSQPRVSVRPHRRRASGASTACRRERGPTSVVVFATGIRIRSVEGSCSAGARPPPESALDLASGAVRTVVALPAQTFALSPDGRLIAAVPMRQDQNAPPVRIVPVEGGDSRAIGTEVGPGAPAHGIAFSADSRDVYFGHEGARGTTIWRVPAAGGLAQPTGILVRGMVTRLSMGPDGRLAISTVSSAKEIWAMRNAPATGGR